MVDTGSGVTGERVQEQIPESTDQLSPTTTDSGLSYSRRRRTVHRSPLRSTAMVTRSS